MHSTHKFTTNDTSPSISTNRTNDTILWVLEKDTSFTKHGPTMLQTYDAMNLTNQFYTNSDTNTHDQIQITHEFQIPVVTNRKIYITTQSSLSVFKTFTSIQPHLS